MDAYNVSYAFNGDLTTIDEAQLKKEIFSSVSISKICLDVGINGSSLLIAFDGRLQPAEKVVLDGIVQNHTPVLKDKTAYPYIDTVRQLVQHKIGNIVHTYIAAQPDEICISKNGQTEYQSIKEAIASNNRPNTIFIVYPGEYHEDNPLILPTGGSLRGAGTPENAKIIANNINADLVVYGRGSMVANLTISGARNARGIYCDCSLGQGNGEFPLALLLIIEDCFIGIEADGNNMSPTWVPDTFYCDKITINTRTQICSKGLSAVNGGILIGTAVQVRGTAPSQSIPTGLPFVYGSYCSGSRSKLGLITAAIWFCQVASYIDDDANFGPNVVKYYYNGIGMQVGSTGTNTTILGHGVDMVNTSIFTLNIQASAAKIDFSTGVFDDSQINNPNGIPVNIKFDIVKFGRFYQSHIGDFQFGSAKVPSKLSIGEGQYISDGIVVFSNTYLDQGAWLDNTLGSQTDSSPSFNIFDGTTTGNCIYLGSEHVIAGFKVFVLVNTNTAVSVAEIAWEYWNGTDWVSIKCMQTAAVKPCYSSLTSFIGKEGKYHVRFGVDTKTPMALKTINGYTKRWVRGRLLKDIDLSPTAEYLKLHTNCQVINGDGFVEYFGDSRTIQSIIPHLGHANPSGAEIAGSTELFVSKNISIKPVYNTYSAGKLTRIGCRVLLPNNIDSGFPIKFEIVFVGSSNNPGNVSWKFRHSTTESGSGLYLSAIDAPENLGTEFSQTVSVSGSNVDTRTLAYFDVSGIDVNPSNKNNHLFWLTIERDATPNNPADTYDGDVSIALTRASYITWNNGAHLLGFQ